MTFEQAFDAIINNVYVDHNYPNRLYFEVVEPWNGGAYNLTSSDVSTLNNELGDGMFDITFDHSDNAIGSPPSLVGATIGLDSPPNSKFYIEFTSGTFQYGTNQKGPSKLT